MVFRGSFLFWVRLIVSGISVVLGVIFGVMLRFGADGQWVLLFWELCMFWVTLRFMGLGYVDHTVLVGIRWGERELASCPCMWRLRSD